MITKFFEYKLSYENISNYYFLVLKFDEKTMINLVNGEFKGLKGISDNINIIHSFFDIRELMLVMDKKSTEHLNKLENVQYDNVDYLTKNTFKVLKRLTQDSQDYPLEFLMYQGFRKHNNHTYKKNITISDKLIKLRKIVMKEHSTFQLMDNKCYKILETIKKVKDFDDFINQVYNSLDNLNIEYEKQKVRNVFEYIILSYSCIFKHEGEILIQDDTFYVPEKSLLLIKDIPSDENKNILGKYIDILKKRYRTKEIPYVHGHIISPSYKLSIPIIRYLDKITF